MTPVVLGLIIVNSAIYLWEQTRLNHNIERFGLWADGVHYQHQWYRLVTSPFLHASVEHIFLNMLTLAIVGPPVEAELGRLRFLGVYLAAALGGSVCSYLLGPTNTLGVGASGAIFGVMGAYFVLARRNRWDTSAIAALIVVNLVISFASPNIDWRAHVGGLVVGAAVGYGLARTMERRRRPAVSAAAGVAVFAAAVIPLVLLSLLPPGHA
jgi:membrane associated rhomboid family serine protease